MLNMFRMLIHPSSGACDLLWIYFMCCIALVRCVLVLRKHCFSLHKDTTPPQPNHTVTPTHIEPEQHNPWKTQQISRKLLRMDVLTSETCWALNNEIIKQVTSSGSIFIQYSVTSWKFSVVTYIQTDEWTHRYEQTLIKNPKSHTHTQEQQQDVIIIKESYYCRLHHDYIGPQSYDNTMKTDF